jgi:hypothetical protein
MFANIRAHRMGKTLSRKLQIKSVLVLSLLIGTLPVHAQDTDQTISSKYITINTVTLADGTSLEKVIISGPPKPPLGFEAQRQAVSLPEADVAKGINTLAVPAFNWVFGCSAVSGAMIAGYYDRNTYPNMYTGPTAGGVMPLNNSSWPTWSDGFTTYPNCPLIASKDGVDGRVGRGSIDDYWVQYNSSASDPYITGGWSQHAWGTAIGDYMKTSQSAYGNTDGSTTFWNYTSDPIPLTCNEMVSAGLTNDGTVGRKLFYEARGYTVTDCYNQKTDNEVAGGFSYAQFKAEIDAGRPVMLNLAGHTVVGVGYNDASNQVYIHDTWDYNSHTMTWGGSYSGMELLSVSIVNLQANAVEATKLYSTFTSNGLYKWNGTAWGKMTSLIPTNMGASETELYAIFAGIGLYKWNGTVWTKLTSLIPTSMEVAGANLYASFSNGLFKWDGAVWTKVSNLIPTNMVASGADLYASFNGSGLFKWNGTVWTKLSNLLALDMVAAGANLYATFDGLGLYQWNGTIWSKLEDLIPTNMLASGTDFFATFDGFGLYKWNGSAWSGLTTLIPSQMVVSGTDLYGTFTGIGLYKWNGTAWSKVNSLEPADMVHYDDKLYASFSGVGLYSWNNAAWSKLNNLNPVGMVTPAESE